MAPFPWMAVAMGASTLANLLFGNKKNKEVTSTTTTEQPPDTAWRDPLVPALSPYMTKMLLGNVGRYENWGQPKGAKGLGMEGWTTDLMSLMNKAWPEILEGLLGKKKKQLVESPHEYHSDEIHRDQLRRRV